MDRSMNAQLAYSWRTDAEMKFRRERRRAESRRNRRYRNRQTKKGDWR